MTSSLHQCGQWFVEQPYLCSAYTLFIAVQIVYVAWLAIRWRRVSSGTSAKPTK